MRDGATKTRLKLNKVRPVVTIGIAFCRFACLAIFIFAGYSTDQRSGRVTREHRSSASGMSDMTDMSGWVIIGWVTLGPLQGGIDDILGSE